MLLASQLSGATDPFDPANDNWEAVTCPPRLKPKHNSSRRNSAPLTHKFPSLHAGWLLCCFILVLMIPFSLLIWPRCRQTDTGSIWKRLPLSAALREAPDNWQTGQRKGAEKIHHSLITWIACIFEGVVYLKQILLKFVFQRSKPRSPETLIKHDMGHLTYWERDSLTGYHLLQDHKYVFCRHARVLHTSGITSSIKRGSAGAESWGINWRLEETSLFQTGTIHKCRMEHSPY